MKTATAAATTVAAAATKTAKLTSTFSVFPYSILFYAFRFYPR